MPSGEYVDPLASRDPNGLWKELGSIPVDDDGYLEENFYDWPAGTDREDIWHWFEFTFGISVHSLMFPH